MSYQVIARKWRPQTFEEVTGQEHITRTLRNALAHDRLHHAYLFSGARGVGKTTTARLLAKALNCHKTDKPNLNPCRTDDPTACPSCIEISESRSLDVLEFDAASNTQVDKIREIILQNINVSPARDRYKVFIIDEVHMLSPSSFNALLKTVEEPPPNVVFVMATTELHKVPETIRSRCQEFDFRTIPLQKIHERLKVIAASEKVDVDESALREIARSGMGSMRDAQSNFDQVISFSGEKISVSDVTHALGIASTEMLTRVVKAIAESSARPMIEVVAELTSRGQDMRNFCRDLLAVFRDLMVFKVSGGEASLVESSVLNTDEIDVHAAHFSESDLLRFFNSMSETESKLKEAVQPRYVLETGLVKLTEMRRVAPIEKLLERLSKMEEALGGANAEARSATGAATAAEKKTLNSTPAVPERDVVEAPDPPKEEKLDEAESPPPVSVKEPPPPAIDPTFLDSLPVKLPPIDSEALEHVDDTWLDAAYEKKLARSGDDLLPIANVQTMVEALVGRSTLEVTPGTSNGSAASAAAPALSHIYAPPVLEEESDDIPEPSRLPDNATEEESLAYARNHPVARRVMRVFRAKIVEVTRS